MRDFYRQKLYNAERRAFADQPRITRTIEQCAERIHQIARECGVWRAACTDHQLGLTLKVEGTKGHTSWAFSNRWKIAVAKWHQGNDWVLIHEMAHLPTGDHFQAHGREFCSLYLRMVAEVYSPAIAERLRLEMVKEGVPYERDAKYVRYLRSTLKSTAEHADRYSDVCLTLVSGALVWARRIEWDGEHAYVSRSYGGAGTPESYSVDDIAYVGTTKTMDENWERRTKRRRNQEEL